jgi:putative lipoic acid-binding regulatory protein
MTTEQAPGFEFPCEYQIKAMGLDDGRFHEVVIEIIRRHCDSVREDSLSSRASRTGKYVSVSIVIEASSREQLDAIYDDLTTHEKVLMRL